MFQVTNPIMSFKHERRTFYEVPENYRMQLTLTEWEVTVFCKRDVICNAISAHFTARLAEPCHASAVIL